MIEVKGGRTKNIS